MKLNYLVVFAIGSLNYFSFQTAYAEETAQAPKVSNEKKKHKFTNRLINEKSPYLLQHAHNPVDWYPWGEEAFEVAKKTQKPILPEEINIGEAVVNLKKLKIQIDSKVNKINPQEKKVLEKMLESPGKVFSRNDIGKIINISKERTIDVMITRLRQKIEISPKNPKYLQTIRGSGYVLWIK